MRTSGMRVVLASDQPEIRRHLASVVVNRLGGVVVGEGENAVRALCLARRLRPDMAIIDSYLPHNVGLGDVRLSRSAGLDAAQAISAEIPNVRVVLVDSVKAASVYPEEVEGILLRPSAATIDQKLAFSWPQAPLSFASLLMRPLPRQKPGFSDVCVAIGACGLIFGLALTASMFLAYIGLPLAVIGGMSLFVGCIGKLFSPLQPRGNKPTEGLEQAPLAGRSEDIRGGEHGE